MNYKKYFLSAIFLFGSIKIDFLKSSQNCLTEEDLSKNCLSEKNLLDMIVLENLEIKSLIEKNKALKQVIVNSLSHENLCLFFYLKPDQLVQKLSQTNLIRFFNKIDVKNQKSILEKAAVSYDGLGLDFIKMIKKESQIRFQRSDTKNMLNNLILKYVK